MIDVDPDFGCHIAKGRVDRDGYVFSPGRRVRAHQEAWVMLHGPVPDGMAIDHLCRNRACCAPHHLELVSKSENERRKTWAHRARRTHCAKGHALALAAIVTPHGGRVCRQCNRDAEDCPNFGQAQGG